MTSLRLKFRHLIARTGDERDNGELIIENGIIREILERPLESFEGETLDLSDCLVLPGFVNLHCHLSLSALKGKTPKTDSMTGWINSVVAQNGALSLPERVKWIHSEAEKLIRSGVTTLADYLSIPDLLGEYSALPFRQVVFLEVLGFNGKDARGIARKIESILANNSFSSPLFKIGLAPHAPYTVSPSLFKELRAMADRYDLPFSCHVAEFFEEVRFIREGGGDLACLLKNRGVYDEFWKPSGASTVQYLDSLGVLEALVGVHLNYIEEDMDLLASRGVAGVFCPNSSRWFGREKYLPVRNMLDRGLNVGLGTDSLASNESLNFFGELRSAEEMLADVSRNEILDMATRQGAEALNLKTGVLAPGFPADLIALRVDHVPSNWLDPVFDPKREKVDVIMVEGKILFNKN